MDGALPRKRLKIYNLTTANAVKMRLTRIVYLHGNFYLEKYWGVI